LKYNPADYFIEILALKVNGKSNRSNIQVEKISRINYFYYYNYAKIFKAICDTYDKSALKQKNLSEIHEVCRIHNLMNKKDTETKTYKPKK
jgi:hypothetical protein